MNKVKRSAGVLCHISALPGKYGTGSLGKEAYRFAKILSKSRFKYWQILPLAQTGYGNSPYSSVSCASGNPYFLDLDLLAKDKLLTKEELKHAKSRGEIDYADLYAERYPLLRTAFSRFNFDSKVFRAYVASGASEDYALYMTAKTVYGGSFSEWPEPVKRHEADALEALRTDYHEEYLFWHFLQFEFRKQWTAFKRYCKGLGIKIIGDIPLYCAYDSADVWAHPELFNLDAELKPAEIAAVPPDCYSEKGQIWGHPTYRWEAHEAENYKWWKARLKDALSIYDVVRIGHFCGLDCYYALPAGAESTEGGVWKKGPGGKIFEGLHCENRIIAEDLGVTDSGVQTLLQRTGFPNTKVLLFAFDGNEENVHLPHNFAGRCAVYTGTHDNDTVSGYLESLSTEEFILFRSRVAAELEALGVSVKLGADVESICEAFLHLALASKAELAILPVQDILKLDSASRMNCPGTDSGNWQFRLSSQPSSLEMGRLKKLIKIYRR